MLLPKNRVKLLLKHVIIASQTHPKGRHKSRWIRSGGESIDSASPRPVSMPASPRRSPACASKGISRNGSLDAHAIQPFYAGLLARACGLRVELKADGDAIVIATR